MTTAYTLLIDGEEKTPPGATADNAAEWDATWEERIDGVGTAFATVQDRTNVANYGRDRVEAEMLVSGNRVFHGETTMNDLELPAGMPWARNRINMADFNSVLDLRLVGVPDGRHFVTKDDGTQGPPPTGTWDAVDLDAHCESTDLLTIQALFDAYAQLPNGDDFDTSTFVRSYINAAILQDDNDKPLLQWTHSTLRQALDELAGLGGFPIFYWIDPDDAFHWINFRDFSVGNNIPTLGPVRLPALEAPAIVTDSSPNGSSSVGGRDLKIKLDGTYMPEQCYVGGITDYIFNGPHNVTLQGTGFEKHDIHDKTKRQIFVDGQTKTQAQKDTIAAAYLQFGERSRVRGSVTVGTPSEAVDGWRCGQLLQIIDARLPAWINGKKFPIQRVKGKLKAANDYREYELEFGDAPIGRFTQRHRAGAQRLPPARLPAKVHEVRVPPIMRPDTDYVFHVQAMDRSRRSIRHSGIAVNVSLEATDRIGAVVAQGTVEAIDPIPGSTTITMTDTHGLVGVRLHTGTTPGVFYKVTALTPAGGAPGAGALEF